MAKTAFPQDIKFTVPDATETDDGGIVCIQGPHGPLRVPVPEGAKPGEETSIRLGPPAQYTVTVPEKGKPGDNVKFGGQHGEELNAQVPPGKKPGETFEVSLPVLLVQVPAGTKPGQEVMYEAPDKQNRCTRIPKGCLPGHYFPVLLLPAGHDVPVGETAWPQELHFRAPDDAEPGQPVCVQGPHGPLLVPLPKGAKAGEQCVYRLGPNDEDAVYEVVVPDKASAGENIAFKGKNGEMMNAPVPDGLKAGEKFKVTLPTVMVRVPPNVGGGQELMFQIPGEQTVRFTTVPSGLQTGQYFPVLLQQKPEEDQKSEKKSGKKKSREDNDSEGYPSPEKKEKAPEASLIELSP